jgi:crossover junction endodeoxyribonuclease RusA
MTVWTLDLPDLPYVSANARVHWSKRSTWNRGWREAAYWAARQQHVPRLDRAIVELDYWPADRRRRDPDNLVPGVLKPCADGIVDAQVIKDDAPEYLTLVMPRIHVPLDDRVPRWALTIRQVGA